MNKLKFIFIFCRTIFSNVRNFWKFLNNSYIFSKKISLLFQEGTFRDRKTKKPTLKNFLIFFQNFFLLFWEMELSSPKLNSHILLIFSKNKFIYLTFFIRIFLSEEISLRTCLYFSKKG